MGPLSVGLPVVSAFFLPGTVSRAGLLACTSSRRGEGSRDTTYAAGAVRAPTHARERARGALGRSSRARSFTPVRSRRDLALSGRGRRPAARASLARLGGSGGERNVRRDLESRAGRDAELSHGRDGGDDGLALGLGGRPRVHERGQRHEHGPRVLLRAHVLEPGRAPRRARRGADGGEGGAGASLPRRAREAPRRAPRHLGPRRVPRRARRVRARVARVPRQGGRGRGGGGHEASRARGAQARRSRPLRGSLGPKTRSPPGALGLGVRPEPRPAPETRGPDRGPWPAPDAPRSTRPDERRVDRRRRRKGPAAVPARVRRARGRRRRRPGARQDPPGTRRGPERDGEPPEPRQEARGVVLARERVGGEVGPARG